ncbi:hypothetical protein DFH29DRAFT_964092, partial [Suillus ampliporus]
MALLALREAFAPVRVLTLSTSTPTASYSVVARKCSRDLPFILMTSGYLGCFFPVFYLQLDSIKHGIDLHFSFYTLVIMNAANVIGRCTARNNCLYTGLINLTIACAVSKISSVIAICIAYGYVYGVFVAALVPLMTLLTARIGLCFAFTVSICVEPMFLGAPISGASLSSHYRWWIPSLFSGLICLAGSSILVVMRF